MKSLLFFLLPLTSLFSGDPRDHSIFKLDDSKAQIEIDIKEPRHKDGLLFTHEGGVIKTKHLRVQAKHISLEEVDGSQILRADGDLFVVFDNKFFIGKALTYDLTHRTGKLEEGIGNFDALFIGGEDLLFYPDNRIEIQKAYATTSDNHEPSWAIKASHVEVNDKFEEKGKNITFNLYDRPLFWLPSLSLSQNRERNGEGKIRYKVFFEKHKRPIFVARYKALDLPFLKIFLRGEYRIHRGPGVGGEIDYKPSTQTELSSRLFYAYDWKGAHPFHYRFQGVCHNINASNTLEAKATWDLVSDETTLKKYSLKPFELETLERTEFLMKTHYDVWNASFYLHPRVNAFQGFKQELPSIKLYSKPLELGESGTFFTQRFSFAYLNYTYPTPLLTRFDSGRFSTDSTLYHPLTFGPLALTPKARLHSILYSNSPSHLSAVQAFLDTSLEGSTPLVKNFLDGKHILTPYALLHSSKPLIDQEHYIFSKEDGAFPYTHLAIGLNNKLIWSGVEYALKISSHRFFFSPFALKTKASLDFSLLHPYFSLGGVLHYNYSRRELDLLQLSTAWTLSERAALSFELRHRSRYAFRRSDPTHSLLEPPHSSDYFPPLFDERTTFLAKWQCNLTPLWTLKMSHYIGYRPQKKFYHETGAELETLISGALKLILSYTQSSLSRQFTINMATLH